VVKNINNFVFECLFLHRETKFKELVALTFTSLYLGKLFYLNEKGNVYLVRRSYILRTTSSFFTHFTSSSCSFSLRYSILKKIIPSKKRLAIFKRWY
jgi:hypothetical protein